MGGEGQHICDNILRATNPQLLRLSMAKTVGGNVEVEEVLAVERVAAGAVLAKLASATAALDRLKAERVRFEGLDGEMRKAKVAAFSRKRAAKVIQRAWRRYRKPKTR